MYRTVLFIRRYKPDVVIALAAPAGVFMLLAARLMGCETVYIESITRVRTPSRTLRLCRFLRAARHILVQWPQLEGVVPHTRYEGSVV